MAVTVVNVPATEPISLVEAKAHLRIDAADEDTVIMSLITVARQVAENYTNRALITQTLELTLDGFPADGGIIEVPRPRLQAVSTVTYADENGVTQTLAATEYQVDAKSEPGRIAPAFGKTWPSTRDQFNAATIRYTAGYGDATAVPEAIKASLKLLVAHLFENREPVNIGNIVNELPFAVEALLNTERVLRAV